MDLLPEHLVSGPGTITAVICSPEPLYPHLENEEVVTPLESLGVKTKT